MGSPKTGPTWRDVSRSVKLKKAKNKLIPKKIRKSHTYQPKNKIFWRHLRQYLNNIVLPPLKKIKSKKSVNYFNQYNCIQKNQPHHLQFEKKYKSSEVTSKKHHKTKRRKSKNQNQNNQQQKLESASLELVI